MRPLACDSVLIEDGSILLILRGHEPFKGQWALPGGFLEESETAEECAVREMKEETGLDVETVRLIGVYSSPGRDPRGVVSAAFIVRRANGAEGRRASGGSDASDARWFDLKQLPKLAADHAKIIADAIRIARGR